MNKPTSFSVDTYSSWHDAKIPADKPLRESVAKRREGLKSEVRADLELLYQILTCMFTYSKNEFKISHGASVSYQTPLEEALLKSASPEQYDSLFKSVDSIINKMWRRAEDDRPMVVMENLLEQVNDLIRTDVRTETLESAQFLANRMNHLPSLLNNDELKKRYSDRVQACVCEPEMKMASGYFAYHALISFNAGYCVEVQIYSAFMSEWRKLSHLLYEQVRIKPIDQHEFGTKEARLISLGHMLHLAECEIQRLAREMKS